MFIYLAKDLRTAMLIIGALLLSITTSHGSYIKGKHDLDVISKFSWPIMSTTLGQSVVDGAKLASLGRLCKGSCSQHMILNSGGRTYLWGSPSLFLLNSPNQVRELEELSGRGVLDVRFGEDFVVILTSDGIIWTAGLGQYGQLAQYETQDSPVFNPVTRLPYDTNTKYRNHIAVGKHHVVALISDYQGVYRPYSWGFNSDFQQLGYASDNETNPIPKKIIFDNGRANSVCCGWEYCAALVGYQWDSLHAVTWGDSRYIGRTQGDASPAQVQGIPSGESIVKIDPCDECGMKRFQTSLCRVWNRFIPDEWQGCFAGTGEIVASASASEVSLMDMGKAVKLACGRTHTLALSRTGRLFAWGSNGYGEILNAKSYSDHATELHVKGKVLDVVAGEYMTIIRSDSGIEHFGWYNGRSLWTPQVTSSVVFPRDLMAESYFMPDTNGAVQIG